MMMKNKILRIRLIISSLILIFTFIFAACQPKVETLTALVDTPVLQQPVQPTQNEAQDIPATPTSAPTESEPDPAVIEAEWQSSPHANSFVLDSQGQNNTCARCHAPVNWSPSMDELPASCFTCKFELEDPPPLIAESDWTDIPCHVCHEVDKKNNVQPEYAWLEIAPLGEYAEVASVTELCEKCHAPIDIPGHGIVVLGGAHPDYECTRCHSAHSTTASCDAVDCHQNVVEPTTPIAGHDADHQAVSCVACHDGSGMEVGPDEETGLWVTIMTRSADSSVDRFAFTSHNVVLEASCDRCHFSNNPWGLSDRVAIP